MAHNLATINERIAMAYTGDTPWHNLGTRLPSGATIHDALIAANLDWQVGLEPVFAKVGDQFINIPTRRAVVRDTDSQVLGVVSQWYEPIQNRAIETVFAPAMDEFGLTVEAAGALGKGEKVWMLFKLPTVLEPVPGDYIKGYGVAILGHDGSTLYEFRPTPIRVVCQNTLNAAVGAGGQKGRIFGIPHGGKVDKPIEAAKVLVTDVLAAMAQTGETFASMARRQMTPAEVVAFIEGVFPNPKAEETDLSKQLTEKRQIVAELVFRGKGAEMAMAETGGQPNAWAVYNAVTEYFDHVATGQSKTDKGKLARSASAVFGANADLKLLALQRARETNLGASGRGCDCEAARVHLPAGLPHKRLDQDQAPRARDRDDHRLRARQSSVLHTLLGHEISPGRRRGGHCVNPEQRDRQTGVGGPEPVHRQAAGRRVHREDRERQIQTRRMAVLGGTSMTNLTLRIAPEDRLPDTDQWINRFTVKSETSNRLYVVSQNREKRHWACSCPAWRTRRECKHLRVLQLPAHERPHEVLV